MNTLFKIGCATVICIGMSACATAPKPSDATYTEAKAALVDQTSDVTEWKTATVTTSSGAEKVCKRTQQSGTRFTKKVCMTQAEWDQIAEESKRTASEVQRRSGQQSNPTGG